MSERGTITLDIIAILFTVFFGLIVGDQLIEFGSVTSDNFVNLQTIATVLQHSKNIHPLPYKSGLNEPLVDSEGYPRSDIDVYSCRHARHQISCLQNDHLIVMKEIEEELVRIHQAARELKSMESDMDSANIMRDGMEVDRIPFALVDRVDSGSPAAEGVSWF
uniref:Nas2 N-terminal domain-containing protein n=1 Tax=Biomphalaria glabrata TaxID=6526 RepID=A0A2C9LWQ8_BIOGL